MSERKSISIVVPVFNEEKILFSFLTAIQTTMRPLGLQYELIFVDDGSADQTWPQIQQLAAQNPQVAGIHFTRNFGKESALAAGIKAAKYDGIITMDADLEHPPALIPQMIHIWQEKPEIFVVQGVKNDRDYLSPSYRLFSAIYYRIFKALCKIDMRNQTDFKLIDRRVADAYLALSERNIFYRGMINWLGYPTENLMFDVGVNGRQSHWKTSSLIKFSVTTITAFSGSPLYIIAALGAFFILLALVFGFIALYQYFTHIAVSGFTTTILLILIQGGVTLISLSIIGLYIQKIFEEDKERPRYAILDTINTENKPD